MDMERLIELRDEHRSLQAESAILKARLIDEFKKLKAENAALKARLDKAVELPCGVGDTVYRAGEFSGIITPGTIDRITLSKFKPTFKCESETIFYLFDEDDIGDVIFLTEAEALAKLEEVKGGVRNEI